MPAVSEAVPDSRTEARRARTEGVEEVEGFERNIQVAVAEAEEAVEDNSAAVDDQAEGEDLNAAEETQ